MAREAGDSDRVRDGGIVHPMLTKEGSMSSHLNALLSVAVPGALLAAATVATLAAKDSRAALEGVWRTVEVVVPGPTPQTFRPGATLAIFHGTHYSRVEVHADGARPILKDPAAATADELRAAWGPFVAEAGTFEVSGQNVLTLQALVAKNPAAMTNGATSVFTYERHGDKLTLSEVRTPSGPRPAPVRVTLERVE
jgi:hypothetical protein